MGRLHDIEQVVWEERRQNEIPATACDGCFRRFHGAPAEREFLDDEEEHVEDVKLFKRCTECEYTICEDCTRPEAQGTFLLPRIFRSTLATLLYASMNPRYTLLWSTGYLPLCKVPLWYELLPVSAILPWVMAVSHTMATDTRRSGTVGMTKMHLS